MERQRTDYEHQLQTLRDRMDHEESYKKKLQEELQTINTSTARNEERATDLLKSSYEETILDLQKEFDDRLEKLQKEHNVELEEEKNATKY